MTLFEILLLSIGALIFVVSFFIPDRKDKEGDPKVVSFSEEEIRKLIDKELNAAKDQISGMVDESINYGMEKTERAMERVSNEKIMAVSEYSDTVLNTIHKNHEEAVFLYDMLNDKHSHLKDTAASVEKSTKEAKEIINNINNTYEDVNSSELLIQDKAAKEPEKNPREEFLRFSEDNFEKITLISPDTDPEPQYITTPVQEDNQIANRGRRRQENILEQLAGATSADDIDMAGNAKIKPRPVTTEKKAEIPAQKASVSKPLANEPVNTKNDVPIKKEPTVSFGASEKRGAENSNERILAMHKLGKSNMAIAKELGLGIGEVNLVLGLFKD